MKSQPILTEAAVAKADIAIYHALVDHCNAAVNSIGEATYEPRTLTYLGFAGRYDLARKLFVGVHRFLPGAVADDVPACDFAAIPNRLNAESDA